MSSLLKNAQPWLFAHGWAWLPSVVFSLRRERMSHDDGLTARGRLRNRWREDRAPDEPSHTAHPS